ncbi:MAG: hypothetical protein ACK56F_17765, partial [bacterium]
EKRARQARQHQRSRDRPARPEHQVDGQCRDEHGVACLDLPVGREAASRGGEGRHRSSCATLRATQARGYVREDLDASIETGRGPVASVGRRGRNRL